MSFLAGCSLWCGSVEADGDDSGRNVNEPSVSPRRADCVEAVLAASAGKCQRHAAAPAINQLLAYDEAIMQNYGLISDAIINHFPKRSA